jgi:hypothetical protein
LFPKGTVPGNRDPNTVGALPNAQGNNADFFHPLLFLFFLLFKENRRTGTGTCVAAFLFEFGFDEAN